MPHAANHGRYPGSAIGLAPTDGKLRAMPGERDDNIVGRLFLDRGPARLLIGKQYRLFAHRIGKQAM